MVAIPDFVSGAMEHWGLVRLITSIEYMLSNLYAIHCLYIIIFGRWLSVKRHFYMIIRAARQAISNVWLLWWPMNCLINGLVIT